MALSAWDQRKEFNKTTPMGRYQQMFPEHPVPRATHKLAADTGQIPKLKERLEEAVKQETPILDWSEFIPSCAKTSELQTPAA